MGSSADWLDVMYALKDRFRCIAPICPATAPRSAWPPGSYSFEGAARATVRTLDVLDVQRATVVGYSMGGRLALYLALRYPERCAALFLESACRA
jgi:pimeloyl-ACP methyl ester carboxylesterase